MVETKIPGHATACQWLNMTASHHPARKIRLVLVARLRLSKTDASTPNFESVSERSDGNEQHVQQGSGWLWPTNMMT